MIARGSTQGCPQQPGEGCIQVLAAILPGVRDLRTPLVTGYTLVFAGWLLLGDHFPSCRHATGVFHQLYQLDGAIGVSTALGVVSFGAYLIGSVFEVNRPPAFQTRAKKIASWRPLGKLWGSITSNGLVQSKKAGINKRRAAKASRLPIGRSAVMMTQPLGEGVPDRKKLARIEETSFRDRTRRPIDDLVNTELSRSKTIAMDEWDQFLPASLDRRTFRELRSGDHSMGFADRTRTEVNGALFRTLVEEYPLLATRLQVTSTTLFEGYDRLRSESQLRLTLFTPLTFLGVVLSFRWTWWALPGALVLAIPLFL